MRRFAVSAGIALLASACAPAERPAAADAAPAPLVLATVSTDRFESHPAFDPVTGDLYFVRSSPSFQGWRIWLSRCTPAGWAAAEPAPFGGAGVDADPFFTRDGRRLYFISSRPDPPAKTGTDLDIWTIERNASGAWSAARRLPAPVNSAGQEWFPRLDRRGRLYFGSDRPGGPGQTDIYSARPEGGAWRVERIGGEVSTGGNEYEFEPAGDGRFAVLMADGRLFRIDGSDGGWGRRTEIATGHDGFHVGPLLSPSGRTLLFARGTPQQSGELFRLPLAGRSEAWPPACPGGARR